MKHCSNIKESACPRFPFFFLAVTSLMLAGCNTERSSDKVIARVNDRVLTQEMIASQIDTARRTSDEEIRHFVNRWVTNELLFQESQKKGYDVSEEIRKKVTEAHKQLSIAELLEKEVYTPAEQDVTPNDVVAYYQSHADEFTLRNDLVLLSVAVFSRNDAAVQFRAAVLGTQGWDEGVKTFRNDTSKGMIAYSDSLFHTQATLYPSSLWRVAAILGQYEVSFPVKTSAGYFVMRLLGQYRKGTPDPLPHVERDIRQRLVVERRQQRYQNFLQQLRNRYTIQFMLPSKDSTAFGGE
jgi:hypothetical protein